MSTMSEELTRLASLHEKGALTDEEFAAAKQKLLGTGKPAPPPAGLKDQESVDERLARATQRRPTPPPPSSSATFVADKIGFLPNVRWSDNLYQAIAIAAFALVGTVTGALMAEDNISEGALAGCALGMLAGLLISGGVLAITGLFRRS